MADGSGASHASYVAFISYAREDTAFARRLKAEIEAWPRPGRAVGAAPVRVFLDQADLTGSAYEAAVQRHLADAAALVVVCSPHARRSPYVDDEIARFVQLHGADRVYPILVDGLAESELDDRRAFPRQLLQAMEGRGMPLGAEFRGLQPGERFVRGRFEAEWYKLLGNLYGLPAGDVQAQDQSRAAQRQRRRLLALGAVAVLLLVLLAAMGKLYRDARQAEIVALNANEEAEAAKKREKENSDKSQTVLAELGRELQVLRDCVGGGGARCPTAPPETGLPAPAGPAGAAPPPASASAAGAAATPAALPPRLYMHIRDEAQRESARALQRAVQAAWPGLVVPGIERLPVGPLQSSELRYFRDAEQAEAGRVRDALAAAGAEGLVLRKVPGYEDSKSLRPRHYELWLRP
jgi:hypothetical protein